MSKETWHHMAPQKNVASHRGKIATVTVTNLEAKESKRERPARVASEMNLHTYIYVYIYTCICICILYITRTQRELGGAQAAAYHNQAPVAAGELHTKGNIWTSIIDMVCSCICICMYRYIIRSGRRLSQPGGLARGGAAVHKGQHLDH